MMHFLARGFPEECIKKGELYTCQIVLVKYLNFFLNIIVSLQLKILMFYCDISWSFLYYKVLDYIEKSKYYYTQFSLMSVFNALYNILCYYALRLIFCIINHFTFLMTNIVN